MLNTILERRRQLIGWTGVLGFVVSHFAATLPSEPTLRESLQETLLEYRKGLEGSRQAAGTP